MTKHIHQIAPPVRHTGQSPEPAIRRDIGGSGFPWLSMPRSGRTIFFWKSPASEAETPAFATRLDRVEIDLARLRQRFETISASLRVTDGTLNAADAHEDLAAVLHALDEQAELLERIQADIVAVPEQRLLAGWRVTAGEIAATEAAALKRDLDCLFQAVRRTHVDLAGVLIELE